VDEGCIGKVLSIQADMGFYGSKEPPAKPTLPVESLGSMLDVGVYTLSFPTFILHKLPVDIRALGTFNPFGVDEQSAAIMRYDGGELVSMFASFQSESSNEAWIYGTDGKIHIPKWFWCAQKAVLYPREGEPEIFEYRTQAEGFEFEFTEVERCLRGGLKESPTIPLDESVSIIETIDKIRSVWQ
jgi:dihydrodiol dehydrogenase / D-xylose 1-dehydrogenase (NADP)